MERSVTTDPRWKVELLKSLRVPYGSERHERTIEPGIFEMRPYERCYRLRAEGCGFFDRSRQQIDVLLASGDMKIIKGDWSLT